MTLCFAGRSDFSDYKHIEHLCRQIEREDFALARLTLDLRRLDFIDSAGLGMLLMLRDQCRKCGIDITLHYGEGQVGRMLESSRIAEIFQTR